MKIFRSILPLLLLSAVLTSTFSAQAQEHKPLSPQAKGAIIGGGSGAILGAVINKRNRGVGGVIGGVVGAGAGYAVGKRVDNKRKARAAAAADARRVAAARQASATREASATRRASAAPAVVAGTAAVAGAAALAATSAGKPAVSADYLPNPAPQDPANPYASAPYRQRSW